MSTIKFSEMRTKLADHQKALDAQIADGQEKLKEAARIGNTAEVTRITGELTCRARAKVALEGLSAVAKLTCCDQNQDCPDI